MKSRILAKARKHLPPAALGVAVLLLWEIAVRGFNIPDYVLPRPRAVLAYSLRNFPEFLGHFWVTAVESTFGLILGIAIGVSLAVVAVMSESTARAIGIRPANPCGASASRIPVAPWHDGGSKGLGDEDVSLFNPREAFF